MPLPILPHLAALVSTRLGRQLAWFAGIGLTGTLLYFGLYNVARSVWPPFASNTAAVALSMAFSFVANRRFTFQYRGDRRRARQAIEFVVVSVATLVASSAGLAVLFALRPKPGRLEENAALIIAAGAMFLVRFWLLRTWVFHPAR